jgi:hypothetical protein
MPTNLDTCIAFVFSPGAIGASAGTGATPTLVSFIDPADYDPATLTYSLDFSKFYNSIYHHHGEH